MPQFWTPGLVVAFAAIATAFYIAWFGENPAPLWPRRPRRVTR